MKIYEPDVIDTKFLNIDKLHNLFLKAMCGKLANSPEAVLSISQIGSILSKSQSAISHYINRGKKVDKKIIKLVAFKNSKGHYRIRKKNLLQFIKKTGIVMEEDKNDN